MYSNWQVSTLLGITVGQMVPNADEWGLDFAMSVTFIGMVIPYFKTRPLLAAVIVAGALSVVANPLPHKLGLMIAAISGITAGVLTERTARQKS